MLSHNSMFSSRIIPCNNNSINRNIKNKEDSTEDSKEDEVEALVEEEDEVIDRCNVVIVECWDTIKDIACSCKRSVPIVLLLTTLLRIVHS